MKKYGVKFLDQKDLIICAIFLCDHSYFGFLIVELTLDFEKYYCFRYRMLSDNAPGIVIETHKIPFSGSI